MQKINNETLVYIFVVVVFLNILSSICDFLESNINIGDRDYKLLCTYYAILQ